MASEDRNVVRKLQISKVLINTINIRKINLTKINLLLIKMLENNSKFKVYKNKDTHRKK